jgi:uncharacterized damage-inducible protein DinB
MKDLLLESVRNVIVRDLDKLQAELKLYPDEKSLWKTEGMIKNSAGNLCLHLCGNLQHYIGFVLGGIHYKRDRDNEFAARDTPLRDLLFEIDKAKKAVSETLPKLTEEQLESDYPAEVFGYPIKTLFFLVHLTAHLSYHLGQVNYHRRLVA